MSIFDVQKNNNEIFNGKLMSFCGGNSIISKFKCKQTEKHSVLTVLKQFWGKNHLLSPLSKHVTIFCFNEHS